MKREALLKELRAFARKQSIFFGIDETRGNGSHYIVYLGNKNTVIKSGEPKPHEAKVIKKHIGL